MKSVISLFSIILFISTYSVSCQDITKTIETPFSKGRSVVALGGNINSGTSGRIGFVSDSKKFINQYAFDINLAKVVSNNFLIGLQFATERTETEQLVNSETEILTLGPIIRLYLTPGKKGGFFLQGGLLFVNYYERNTLFEQFLSIDESITGHGYAGYFGLGYTYVLNNSIGFEVGFNYRLSSINAEVEDHIGQVKANQNFTRADIMFNFGFIILFNKIKE